MIAALQHNMSQRGSRRESQAFPPQQHRVSRSQRSDASMQVEDEGRKRRGAERGVRRVIDYFCCCHPEAYFSRSVVTFVSSSLGNTTGLIGCYWVPPLATPSAPELGLPSAAIHVLVRSWLGLCCDLVGSMLRTCCRWTCDVEPPPIILYSRCVS